VGWSMVRSSTSIPSRLAISLKSAGPRCPNPMAGRARDELIASALQDIGRVEIVWNASGTSGCAKWRGLIESERTALIALTDDLPDARNHPGGNVETRKRILRAILEEVVPSPAQASLERRRSRPLEVTKSCAAQHRWKTSPTTERFVEEPARLLPDASIASV
jgi:hypothetical protein